MTARRRVDLPSVLFVGAVLVGAVLLGWQESRGLLPEGSEAPAFIAERLDGQRLELASLRGQVVVVNFWATWCPPCREELPYLVELVRAREAQGVTLLAVSTDDRDGQKEAVSRFVGGLPALRPYAVLGTPDIGFAYQVRALPTLFVLDRQGRVIASHQGQASERQISHWLDDALEQHGSEQPRPEQP